MQTSVQGKQLVCCDVGASSKTLSSSYGMSITCVNRIKLTPIASSVLHCNIKVNRHQFKLLGNGHGSANEVFLAVRRGAGKDQIKGPRATKSKGGFSETGSCIHTCALFHSLYNFPAIFENYHMYLAPYYDQ